MKTINTLKKTVVSILLICPAFSWAQISEKTEGSATCVDCAEKALSKKSLSQLQVESALSKVSNDKPRWVDAYFLYDVESKNEKLNVSVKNYYSMGIDPDRFTEIYSIYLQSFGGSPGKVNSYDQAISYLNSKKELLTSSEKLALLSMIGNKLSSGYSSSTTQNPSMEALFQNAVKGQTNGGICGDIHTYLSQAAAALGFEAVGIHSAQWSKDLSKNETGGHAIAHFRDPKTGEYYMQNYTQIYNTKQKTLQGAVDVSTRLLGPLTGVSDVNSRPGVVHMYVPQTAQWIKSAIEKQVDLPTDAPIISMSISQSEKTVGLQANQNFGNSNVRAFFVHSDVNASEGKYGLDAIGLSYKGEVKKEIKDSIIDEIGLSSSAYGGAMRMQAPVILPGGEFADGQSTNGFLAGSIKGTARINQTTGKLEFVSKSMDLKTSERELKAGIEQAWKELPLKVDIERTWEIRPTPETLNGPYRMETKHDRVGVIWDQKSSEQKVYVTVSGDVYLLEGAEKMSAIGLRNAIKASVPTDNLGTFSVALELGKVVNNKSKDPFYDLPASTSIVVDWRKKVFKASEVGVSLSHTKGPSAQPFSVIGSVGPQLDDGLKRLKGSLFFHSAF
jgi:hypothetical protein